MVSPVIGFLTFMWSSWLEFLASPQPSFILQTFKEWTSTSDYALSLFFSLLSNKTNNKYKFQLLRFWFLLDKQCMKSSYFSFIVIEYRVPRKLLSLSKNKLIWIRGTEEITIKSLENLEVSMSVFIFLLTLLFLLVSIIFNRLNSTKNLIGKQIPQNRMCRKSTRTAG